MSDRAKLRAELINCLRTDEDVDQFLVDYFPLVASKRAAGMTRNAKITLLIESEDVATIRQQLTQSQEGFEIAAAKPESGEGAQFSREIARLKQYVRDLEQQLSGQKSEPTIGPRDGLERISRCLRDIEELSATQSSFFEAKWLTIGHNTLSAIEAALGKFHNICREFRVRFMIEKELVSPNYLALLLAAESILKQEIEENDRASKSWTQTMSSSNSGNRGGGFFR